MNRALDVLGRTKSSSVLGVLLIALTAAGLDALSKSWAQAALPSTGAVSIIGNVLQFDLGYNTGIAFGLFANVGWPIAVLVGGAILVLAVWLFSSLKQGLASRRVLPLGLILGGAVANVVDRVVDGRVTDFIDVGLGAARWPTFNLADSLMVVGFVASIWIMTRRECGDRSEGR